MNTYLLCLGMLGSLMRIKCGLIMYVSLVKFIYDMIQYDTYLYTIYSPSIMYLVVGPFFEHIYTNTNYTNNKHT